MVKHLQNNAIVVQNSFIMIFFVILGHFPFNFFLLSSTYCKKQLDLDWQEGDQKCKIFGWTILLNKHKHQSCAYLLGHKRAMGVKGHCIFCFISQNIQSFTKINEITLTSPHSSLSVSSRPQHTRTRTHTHTKINEHLLSSTYRRLHNVLLVRHPRRTLDLWAETSIS